ncbi:heparan-alpha-glucosaminide N-acetyltransferase domain-containing protein [Parabacteroides sp. OttesenSCG-928-N08]|nr:heparan-alpha-glucosaminide N-acetyltransferase domain-containing protein [Parabacteroides sp. OttesenSCG-928-N08]
MIRKERDISIDVLRGIAVLALFAGNSMGIISPLKSQPYFLHLVFTFGAPLFIVLASYMASVNREVKSRPFSYYLKRCVMLLFTAAFLDGIVWNILPFTEYDVLCVIGVIMPLCYLLFKGNSLTALLFIAAVLGVTAWMQQRLPYQDYPLNFPLFTDDAADWDKLSWGYVIKAALYDGWFPLFPWMAYAGIGFLFARYRKLNGSFAKSKPVVIGLLLAVGGFLWWYTAYSEVTAFDRLVDRDPYGELFYPPTVAYMITSFGVCLLLIAGMDSVRGWSGWRPLCVLGEASMFNYILQSTTCAVLFTPLFEENQQPLWVSLCCYAGLTVVGFCLSLGVRRMKQKVKRRNFLFNFYFGG